MAEQTQRPERTCSWCEGRKVVGQLARGEEPKSVSVCSVEVPIIGTMRDVCCKICDGTGVVPENFNLSKRLAEIRAAKDAGKKT